MQNYSITSGDTLWGIVTKTYGDKLKSNSDIMRAINCIAEKNNISDPNLIYAGDKIKLPDYNSIFKSANNDNDASKSKSTEQTNDENISEDDFHNWLKTGYSKLNADDEYEVEDFDMVNSDISYQDQSFLEPYKEGVSNTAENSINGYDDDNDSALSFEEYTKKETEQYYDMFGKSELKTDAANNTGMYSQEAKDMLAQDFEVLDADSNGKLDKNEISAMYAALDASDSSDFSVDGKIKFQSIANADYQDDNFQKLYNGALGIFNDSE